MLPVDAPLAWSCNTTERFQSPRHATGIRGSLRKMSGPPRSGLKSSFKRSKTVRFGAITTKYFVIGESLSRKA